MAHRSRLAAEAYSSEEEAEAHTQEAAVARLSWGCTGGSEQKATQVLLNLRLSLQGGSNKLIVSSLTGIILRAQ